MGCCCCKSSSDEFVISEVTTDQEDPDPHALGSDSSHTTFFSAHSTETAAVSAAMGEDNSVQLYKRQMLAQYELRDPAAAFRQRASTAVNEKLGQLHVITIILPLSLLTVCFRSAMLR